MKQGRARRSPKPHSEASEEIFHLLFHDHPLPMWVVDLETLAFLDANLAAVEKYGYAREEFLAMNLKDIRPREDGAPLPDGRESLRQELQHSGERRHRLRDGRIIDVEINSHALEYRGRRAALAMSQDITERKRAEDALRESEARLRAMFECSRDAIGVSKKGIHILANPSYLKLFGFESNQSIVGTSIIDSIAPGYRQQTIHNVQRRAAGEPVARFYEARGMKVDGTEFDAEFNVSTYVLNGEIYSVATIRDITERKQAEEALRESEKKYHRVVDNLREVVFQTDTQGTWRFLNPAWEEITGFGVRESIGRLSFDFVHPDDRQWNSEQFHFLIDRKKDHCRYEIRYVTGDGGIRWVEVYTRPVLDDEDHVVGTYGTLTDITERKRVETALRASESQFRELWHATVEGIVIHENGIIVEVNDAVCLMSGYKPENLIGKSILDFVPPESQAGIRERLVSPAEGAFEIPALRADGTRIALEAFAKKIHHKGKSVRMVAIRDITARKRAEESLRESEARFRQLSEAALEGIAITEKGVLVDGNTRLAAMLGSELGEMIGRPVSEFIAPDSRTLVLKYIAEDYEGGYEHLLLRKDGSTLPVESHARTVIWNGRTARVTALLDLSTRKLAEEQLHKLSLAVDQSPASIVITDTRGNIEYVNPKFTRVTGYTSEEALGENPRILKSGETSPGEYEKLWETITAGREWRGEFHNRKKNGELFWETASISPVKNKDNVITNFVAVKEDITDRKNAERELTLMAQTVASARDCIYITDLENKLLFVNDAFRATYGYTAEELLGEDTSMVRSPDAPAAVTGPILRDTLSGGWHGEILHRRKDGSDFPVELWTSVVRDEAGVPMALVGVARDIADRKRAEEHLRRSEEEFRLIAENVADMIAVVDLDGRRIYNNPSYRAILGDPESLKGTDGFQEIHPDDRERVKQVFQDSIRTGIGQRIEYRFLLKDGSVRSIDSKGSVIRDAGGRISQVIVVSRDVTEEKRLAAQFLRSQRMESIGTLAGGIAHDLNNVLAPIMMAIEILRSKMPDPAGQRIINTIETSAKRGADIVRQVLAFGRGVKGDRILVQLRHVINEVVKIAEETFPRSIEINAGIPRNLWTVSADPTQMHQVLLNMLLNARDAMPGGGTLAISAENTLLDAKFSRMHPEAKPGAYVSMAISDTGTGIPSDIREKIFEPFFTTKEIGMGTGLGLSTTLAIVKSHEGFINLQSESGKGTTFRIYIPATGTPSGEAAADEAMDLPMGKGELVLIIDDEAAIREITRETLQAHGYNAITASDGEKGVAAFSENKENISIVITDIMMPVMDGADAILALRRIKPDVKIISTSGLTGKGQIASPPDPNVQAFLTKPYTAEKLLKALAAALG